MDQQMVADRPVSYGRASFEALLSRFEQVADEHRDLLGVIMTEAEALIRTVTDADAAAFEVEEVHRTAEIRIGQAQTAQAAAVRREAVAALEDKAQADAAAEDALAELEAVRTQTADQLAEHQAAVERAQADQRAAHADLEVVRAEAAKTIAEARDAAEQHKRATIAERDRVLADLRQQIDQAQADAHAQVTAMHDQVNAAQAEAEQQLRTQRGELADATSATTRAQAEQAAAHRAAELDRAAVTQLRLQLDTERADHHREITETRREAHDERAALTRAHAEQLTAVLTTIGQAATRRATDTPPKAPKPQIRRARDQ